MTGQQPQLSGNIQSKWKGGLNDEPATQAQKKAAQITEDDVVAVFETLAEEMGDDGLLMTTAIPPETYLRE